MAVERQTLFSCLSMSRFKFRRAFHNILKQARKPHFEIILPALQQSLISSAAGIAVRILIMHNNVRKRRILRALLEQDTKTAFVRYRIFCIIIIIIIIIIVVIELNYFISFVSDNSLISFKRC